ncbi:MAG: hypothetical protein IKD58_01520 [Loktanella sp.]|jgi:hypothetical protein|nr:hypothetical protein [Loktanella sp.]
MSALRDEFCKSIKARYPVISAKADAEYQRLWDDFEGEHYSYSWFEALANALNKEMNKKVSVTEHQELLAVIGSSFESGDEAIRQCIEVAFVENLFWQVTPLEFMTAYWSALPENLKELYIAFHGRGPLEQFRREGRFASCACKYPPPLRGSGRPSRQTLACKKP